MWDCKIPQSHNSTMIQSHNGPMLQSHNEDANVEPFQVTVEAHSSVGPPDNPQALEEPGLLEMLAEHLDVSWSCVTMARRMNQRSATGHSVAEKAEAGNGFPCPASSPFGGGTRFRAP